MTIATPPDFEPNAQVLVESQVIGRQTGAAIRVVNDPAEGAKEVDVLYTDVWASMGQEAEAEARKAKFQGFQINRQLMSHAKRDCIILHCLPAHYGDEIEYAASRTTNSAIFDQAENRMHAQNALLVLLTGAGPKRAAKVGARKPAKSAARRSAKPAAKRGVATAARGRRGKPAARRR